jgi:hypothetical protein
MVANIQDVLMKIYVGHAGSYNYKTELYDVLKESFLWDEHEFILPYEHIDAPKNSEHIINSCQILLADVSYPSTGLGIELAWARAAGLSILAVHQRGVKVSSSVAVVTPHIAAYDTPKEIIVILENFIKGM